MKEIYLNGVNKGDRTGTGTYSVFGSRMEFDLQEGFPLLTTKALHLPSLVHELLWFLSGDTNTKYLNDNGVTFWDEWANENGDLGPIYGQQWRGGLVDQIKELVHGLRDNPDSRRHVVTAWEPEALPDENLSPQENADFGLMALAPCHCLFQFYVADGKLSCQLYQRSADVFLGVPYNIASYSLLTHMVAQQVGLEVGKFIWVGGDTHLYKNHIAPAEVHMARKPTKLCKLVIKDKPESMFDYKYDMFEFVGYDPQPVIKAPISI